MPQELICRRHSSLAARIGISRADITPPVGIYARNWGAAKHDVAESIHRPLTATVMTIGNVDDVQPLVLIDADLGWWKTPQAFQRVQRRLLATAGVHKAQLIFALSHTHAGPPLMEPDDSLPGSELIQPWMEQMVSSIESAIQSARASSVEATLEWHTGHCNLAAYRDLPDPQPDNRRIVCGFNPEGRADDTLIVGRVCDISGRMLATLVNYACHPTTLAWDNRAISPDYIGATRETVEQATGAPAIFLQGASGELAPRAQYVGDTKVADRHGRQLAYAALAVLEDMEPAGQELAYVKTVESGAPLAVWCSRSRTLPRQFRAIGAAVELAVKDWPSAAVLELQRAQAADRALEERLRRKRDIRRALGDGQTFQLPITAWRLGEAALIGSCCEAYSMLQIELRKRFDDRKIVCMNLVNGSMGYLPPRQLYDQDLYQVWQTPFDRGSLELTLEAMSQALHDLFRDTAAQPQQTAVSS